MTQVTTLLDVTREDSVLFYWQREVVQSCRGANNCGTLGFVNNFLFLNEFLRIHLLQLKVGLFSLF